jgi:hypothetical protein
MPAVTKSQQRLMGQAYQVRKWMDSDGKDGIDPNTIESEYRKDIVRIAKDMSKKSLKDFASTEHKGLKEEEDYTPSEGNPGEVPTLYPYLKPESNKPKKRSASSKLQNLADYREFIQRKK